MAAIFESVAGAGISNGAGPLVITKPTGLAVGDLMIVFLSPEHTLAAAPAQTGWTEILLNQTTSGDSSYIHILRRFATEDDVLGSNFSFVEPASYRDNQGSFGGILCRISGADLITPIGAFNSGMGIGSSQSQAITITPAADSLLLFSVSPQRAYTISNYAIATDNPTWTEQKEQSSDWTGGTTWDSYVSVASATRAADTATGNGSFSLSAIGRALSGILSINAAVVYAISGVVTLQAAPVSGAVIRCIRQSDNVALATQTSDANGTYTFSDLDSGEVYHLAVEYEADDERYNAFSLWDIIPVAVE